MENMMANEKSDPAMENQTTFIDEGSSKGSVEMTEFDASTHAGSRKDLIRDSDDCDQNQTMFFTDQGKPRRIDFVLVYDAEKSDAAKERQKKTFEQNLRNVGIILEHDKSADSKLVCVKIHSPWEALTKGAKLLGLRKRIDVKMLGEKSALDSCFRFLSPDQSIVPDEENFFTAPFDPSSLKHFVIGDREEFFTNAERNLITKLFLDSTECPVEEKEGDLYVNKGIDSLINHEVYLAAFPLHEGNIKPLSNDPNFFKGKDKDRLRLYYSWAKPSNAFRRQPLEYVRKYFGEKIGLYFAWLGFYTTFLIPATVFGLCVFLYGLITLATDQPSKDVCNTRGPGNYALCPLCDNLCGFEMLSDSCLYARLTHVFENYGTVAFAIFMAGWALAFLEFWKRNQATLQFTWNISDYEAYEKMRPGYEKKAKKYIVNPITKKKEPTIPAHEQYLRLFTSLSMIFFLICVVCTSIFAVLVYRLAVAAALFAMEQNGAKLITTVTASILNLIIITVLGFVYNKLALIATKLEKHKTFSDHEESYTFKIIVFQFINYYGSIIYIAFFKGSFIDPPGMNTMYVFGKYRQDECDPTGCFVELTIQLAIIMIGKQALNGFIELVIPAIKNCFRRVNENPIHRQRWEDDYALESNTTFLFFDEYLEMVIQFGFVTLFVAAFPLAPLFALINNVIEIRLDAYKALKMFRRPTAARAQDIGAWYPILRAFAYLSVITNGFIIAWTSEFIPKLVYIWNSNSSANARHLVGYLDWSLSSVNTSLLTRTNGPKSEIYDKGTRHIKFPECRFRGHVTLDENFEYEPTREYWQILFAKMAFVIVFEHLCFFLMSLISIFVPDIPGRIKQLWRYERELEQSIAYEDSFAPSEKSARPCMYEQVADVTKEEQSK